MNKVLVIAVHPDDETLGCGGTLLKHKSQGDQINWLIATSLQKGTRSEILRQDDAIEKVGQMYGFKRTLRLNIPTMQVDTLPMKQIIDKISDIVNMVKPNILYLPFKEDIHSDHRVIFQAGYSCTKLFRYSFIKLVLMMETISETEFAPSLKDTSFIPNYFTNVSSFLDKKIKIMKIYQKEIGYHPFPRSVKNIKSLATHRGAIAGCRYAESFMLLKEIC